MQIKSILSVIALGIYLLAGGTASAMGFCNEGIDKKIAAVQTALGNIRALIPEVPPNSADYFSSEYHPALDSGSHARFAALESQPYYNEWTVRKSLASIETAVHILKDGPTNWVVHPYPSIPQVRIYWASNVLLQMTSLEHDLTEYADLQRRSSHPMVDSQKLWLLSKRPVNTVLPW